MAQKYTLSHKSFAKMHCFKRTLKGILPHDTLSHNFLINCNTPSHNFLINCIILSHNFYQKRTPCRIIFTVKGLPVERHIPSSQVWEYPRGVSNFKLKPVLCNCILAIVNTKCPTPTCRWFYKASQIGPKVSVSVFIF